MPLLVSQNLPCAKCSAATTCWSRMEVALRSLLTLFEAAGEPDVIAAAMVRWFDGQRDPATLAILAAPG